MRYFKRNDGEVFGYDPETQDSYIQQTIADGWEEVTGNWPPPPPPLTVEDITAILSRMTQRKLDEISNQWGYDGIISAASYVNSTNEQFAQEAQALIAWRDRSWEWIIAVTPTIIAGTTANDYIQQMPPAPEKPVN